MPSVNYTVVSSLELTKDNSPKLFEDYFDENIDIVVKFCYINEFKIWAVFIGVDIFTLERLYQSFSKDIFIQAYELSKDNTSLQEVLKPYIDKISTHNNDMLVKRLDVVSDDMSKTMDYHSRQVTLRQKNIAIINFIRRLYERTGDYDIIKLYLDKLYSVYYNQDSMVSGRLDDVCSLIASICEANGRMKDSVFDEIKGTGVLQWVEFQFIQRHDILGKLFD